VDYHTVKMLLEGKSREEKCMNVRRTSEMVEIGLNSFITNHFLFGIRHFVESREKSSMEYNKGILQKMSSISLIAKAARAPFGLLYVPGYILQN
jgi:hypothetical protein